MFSFFTHIHSTSFLVIYNLIYLNKQYTTVGEESSLPVTYFWVVEHESAINYLLKPASSTWVLTNRTACCLVPVYSSLQ